MEAVCKFLVPLSVHKTLPNLNTVREHTHKTTI